jgi:opacity protein-like surface antigen
MEAYTNRNVLTTSSDYCEHAQNSGQKKKQGIKTAITLTLLITTFCLDSTFSYAQTEFIAKGGVNISQLNGEQISPDWKTSYHLGIGVNFEISKRVSLGWELQYSDKGFGGDRFKVSLSYLAMPIVAQYKLTSKFIVEGGMGISYLMATTGDETILSKPGNIWNNKMDFEGIVGVAFRISDRFTINARYEHGFSNVIGKDATVSDLYIHLDPVDVLKDPPTLREEGFKHYNRNIQFSIAFLLRKKLQSNE